MQNNFYFLTTFFLFYFICFNYSFAGECTSWFGLFSKEAELSQYMKKVLIDEIAIEVTSDDLKGCANFENLIIQLEKRYTERLSTGGRPNLNSLEGTRGHVVIVFKLNTSLQTIPTIKEYIDQYECKIIDSSVDVYVKTDKKDSFSIFDLSLPEIGIIKEYAINNYQCVMREARLGEVTAEALFLNEYRTVKGRIDFLLKEGYNEVVYCDFHELDGNITSVFIKLKDYPISFSSKIIKKVDKNLSEETNEY